MKKLLCCANGLSTSILMQKMRKWGKEKGIELEVIAKPSSDIENVYKDYDCILVGPQIAYQLEEIKGIAVGKPVDKINPADYGLGNVENIMKQVHKLLDK